jgi:hypothetical protein
MTTQSSEPPLARLNRPATETLTLPNHRRLETRRPSQPAAAWMPLCLAFSLAVCLQVGCGPTRPKLVPVSGTVSLDGEPLAFKSLLFIPAGETAGNGAGGYTNGKGEYSLIAVIFGGTKDYDGCPPGHYRVVVSEPTIPITAADFGPWEGEDQGDEPAVAVGPVSTPVAHAVPQSYTSAGTTTLMIDVPESGGVIDLELTSASP